MTDLGPVALAAVEDRGRPDVSFEFFPPKTDKAEERLWDAIRKLETLNPRFVSVTYGAGGSTRDRTHRTVKRIKDETTLTPAAHLTCVDASKDEVDAVVKDYWEAGIRHIVALRGDPAGGIDDKFVAHPEGYKNATELVKGIKAIGDFEVSVAAYPEVHPESPHMDHEIDVLKQKIDAGADRAITQFFFDAECFIQFHDRCRKAGIEIPIVPGVMLQPNFNGLKKMAGMCGAKIPEWYDTLYEGLDEDKDTRQLLAASIAAEFCATLQAEGFNEFHFYTLNRADLAYATCRVLGMKQQVQRRPMKEAAE